MKRTPATKPTPTRMVVTETRGRAVLRALALVLTALSLVFAAPSLRAECVAAAGGIGGTGVAPGAKTPGSRGTGKDRGGIGGTGRSGADAGGIGGTGVRDDGGIGGTGLQAGGVGGTGIVGVITGFGSVCVNGLEVEYDASTPVDANGAPAQARALGVGQVVVVDAAERGGKLHADRIDVRDVAVGPIERVDAARGEIVVLGQHVRIDPSTNLTGPGPLARGGFVAVSGLRSADGSVAATRIAPAPKSDRVSVTGRIAEHAKGGAAVGNLPIAAPKGGPSADLGSRVALVVGRIDPHSGVLRAERIEPAVHFARAPERLSVEGIVQGPSAQGFRIEHAEVDASQAGPGATPPAGTRVIVNGALDAAGLLRAERIEVVAPERPVTPDRDATKSPSSGARDDDARHERHDTAVDHDDDDRPVLAEKAEKPEAVEAPEVERPEAPEAPEIETPEAPERPEVEKPETPEVPEVERPETPEVPEVERPETPEVPEVERPETPEVPAVERPETPEVPEVARPETPEIPEVQRPETPEVPEVQRPETPELPEVQRPEPPEVPEVEKPEAPEPPERPEHGG